MTVFDSRGGLKNHKKPIENHPELPVEHETKEILKRKTGMPMEMMLKSKMAREILKAKSNDLDEVETRRVTIGEDLRKLLEKLADDKPVVQNNDNDKPEVTILKKKGSGSWRGLNDRQGRQRSCADIGRENPRGHTTTDYVSEEESDIQDGNRTPRTRSRVLGVVEIRRRQ